MATTPEKSESLESWVCDAARFIRCLGNVGTNEEKSARQCFVNHDLVERVFELPDNRFYNTTAPDIVLFPDRNRTKIYPGRASGEIECEGYN